MNLGTTRNVLAVDIGGSKLMAGIADAGGNILCRVKQPLKPDITGEHIISIIMETVDLIRNRNPGAWEAVDCVGMTIPGLADHEKGIWVYACFSKIRDLPIARIISYELNIPVFIENDVNACALGEKMYGSCKGVNDFIWMTISNGVGGALVLNGELYRGAYLNAGEIGHFNVMEGGYECGCGNKGCLEAYAAGPAIVRRYLERVKPVLTPGPGVNAGIKLPVSEPGITAEKIAQAAEDGDEVSREVFNETGYYLGKALSYAINLVNPEKVILGGGVSMSMHLFYEKLIKTINDMVFLEANKNIIIEKTALGYEAALIGAAAVGRKGMERI
ncbi:MAG: ROK family protein [Clostridiaceae bacterium]|nr:ROK family protein [Clostridiaceae bacterium]